MSDLSILFGLEKFQHAAGVPKVKKEIDEEKKSNKERRKQKLAFIYWEILNNQDITRQELIELSGLSRDAITRGTKELIRMEMIESGTRKIGINKNVTYKVKHSS